MSNIVSALVQKRKIGSPTRKGILMFMATFASDDGTGVWVSKATMSRDLEMGKRTVQVCIDDLVEMGLVSEVGTRSCSHGYTIEYRLNLSTISELPKTKPDNNKSQELAGAGVAPVQRMHPTRAGRADEGMQIVHPNRPRTIHKPPTRAREAGKDEEVDRILATYPPDRLRGKAACLANIEEAMKEGVAPKELLRAVKAYATDSAGFTRSKVCFSDNWFRSRRWQAYVEKQAEDREKSAALEADHHARLACWISDRSPMCKHITAPQVIALLASKLVTQAQIQAAGLRI